MVVWHLRNQEPAAASPVMHLKPSACIELYAVGFQEQLDYFSMKAVADQEFRLVTDCDKHPVYYLRSKDQINCRQGIRLTSHSAKY